MPTTKIFAGSLCALASSIFVASSSYSSSCVLINFVDHSHKDIENRSLTASLEKFDSGNSILHFGGQAYSEHYYFKTNGMIYKVKTCGAKCNPRVSIVKELAAKGKCKITKLKSGKFNLHCVAIDEKGEKYDYALDNTVKENEKDPCYSDP